MTSVISPILVFLAAALGAVGMAIALPRRRVNPQPLGALLCAIAGGVVIVALGFAAFDEGQLPNVYFYIFSAIALGAALRVVTHQRPVYAALYFILTIIASAGLFLILSAEFMAFALIIIYAGAILITYLFVLMLATQAPVEEEADRLADYDAQSREPIVAAGLGFLLLAVLTTLVFRGVGSLESAGPNRTDAELMAALPVRTEQRLMDAGVLTEGERLQRVDEYGEFTDLGRLAIVETEHGGIFMTEPAPNGDPGREIAIPEGMATTNVERLGFNLLFDHPGAIEIAGVILLMAMLGAVVLSRRQVDIDEAEKARAARHLTDRPTGAEDPVS